MKRIYLKAGQIIGCKGYTDLQIQANGTGLKLFSTEGGDLDYYDEDKDEHFKIKFDMNTKIKGKKNPNFGKMYYEVEV